MKTIDFCIPFVGSGLRYAEFLISNLLATAAHPERISISLSAHSPTAVELIKNSSFNKLVKNIVVALPYAASPAGSSREKRFVREGTIGSANHCSAMQSLFAQATADVIIFSDHDMAFLTTGWDLKIIKILEDNDLCGVGYPNYSIPTDCYGLPALKNLFGYNYQNVPNLSFLAITKKCAKNFSPQGITSFHHYLADGGLPFQIVNTQQMADALHLPLGTIWLMDSGFEIPFVIESNKLKYQTFVSVAFDNQDVFSSSVFIEPLATGNLPDVFIDGVSGEPLLAHYGRGTLKTQWSDVTPFDCFVAAVNDYVAKSIL